MSSFTLAADSTTTGLGTLTWLISLVVAVVFAWLCSRIANGKGYSPLLFAILGFFFSCITLVVVLVLPRKNTVV